MQIKNMFTNFMTDGEKGETSDGKKFSVGERKKSGKKID